MRFAACLTVAFALIPSFSTLNAKDKLADYHYSASYFKMEDGEDIRRLPTCASFSRLAIVDGRTDKARIGSRRWEEGHGPAGEWAILLEGEIVPWVEDGVRQLGSKAGFRTGDPAGPVITVTLVKLVINEEKYDSSTWKGHVALDVAVTRDGAATSCFAAQIYGSANNYGDSGKKINYDETLNQALDRAIIDLFAPSALGDAVCNACRGPASPASDSPKDATPQ